MLRVVRIFHSRLSILSALLYLPPFLIAGFYVLMAVWFPAAYILGTYEDLYGEWAQTYLFATICIFAFLLAIKKSRSRLFFTFLALAAFYTVMEEISWGQRLLNFKTPEFFMEHNIQHEFNLHNLLTGPVDSWVKTALGYMISATLLIYGVVYSFLYKKGWRGAIWLETKGLPAPPFFLWPFFAIAAYLEPEPFHFNEAEVAELLVGLAVACTTFHYWFVQRYDLTLFPIFQWKKNNLKRYRAMIALILLVVSSLSVATTFSLYQSPKHGKHLDNRLVNGYEKFAKRYERYEHWTNSIDLLQRFDQARPDNTVILRWIAKDYRKLGDEENFRKYNQRALNEGLRRFDKFSKGVSTNLSLSKTYKQIGDQDKSRYYALRAYRFARSQVLQKPDSPHGAYWFAKSCEQINNHVRALKYFHKAYRLEPSKSRYRHAYFKKKKMMARIGGYKISSKSY